MDPVRFAGRAGGGKLLAGVGPAGRIGMTSVLTPPLDTASGGDALGGGYDSSHPPWPPGGPGLAIREEKSWGHKYFLFQDIYKKPNSSK